MQSPTTEEEARARIALYSRIEAVVGHASTMFIGPLLAFLTWLRWPDSHACVFVLIGGELALGIGLMISVTVADARFRIEEGLLHEEVQRDPNPPVLLLRSFTNFSLTLKPATKPYGKSLPIQGNTFLHSVADECQPLGRAVAIGSVPGTTVLFPPSIFVFNVEDAHWVDAFTVFAHASRAILLLPGITPGAVHEIKTLVSKNLLEKTLVVMPPVGQRIPGMHSFDHIHEAWDEARGFWRDQGAFLPEYDPEGMVYIPNPDLSVRRKQGLEGRFSTLRKAATALIPDVPPGVRPLSDLMSELRHLYRAPGSGGTAA